MLCVIWDRLVGAKDWLFNVPWMIWYRIVDAKAWVARRIPYKYFRPIYKLSDWWSDRKIGYLTLSLLSLAMSLLLFAGVAIADPNRVNPPMKPQQFLWTQIDLTALAVSLFALAILWFWARSRELKRQRAKTLACR